TAIFVLSAISPTNLEKAIRNISITLKIGGKVLLRDYYAGDHAQLRFGEAHKLGENYHARSDGTLSKFFTQEELVQAFEKNGIFRCERVKLQQKTIENQKRKLKMDRQWIDVVFIKVKHIDVIESLEQAQKKQDIRKIEIKDEKSEDQNVRNKEECDDTPLVEDDFGSFFDIPL
ncbi:MAG: putative S-adenosyl-L-methionine-dependent methyltransferase, partial [Streblomastix strix]